MPRQYDMKLCKREIWRRSLIEITTVIYVIASKLQLEVTVQQQQIVLKRLPY